MTGGEDEEHCGVFWEELRQAALPHDWTTIVNVIRETGTN